MGGSSSTRRVVVESDEGSSVIQVSDAAALKLKNKIQSSSSDPSSSSIPSLEPTYNKITGASSLKGNELEEFYIKKLKDLEERNARVYESTKQEFTRSVQEVENKFLKYSGSPVCRELQDQVMTCYQTYPNETLRCSELVNQFTHCVELARKNIVLTRNG